jgi:tellurite resistance protein
MKIIIIHIFLLIFSQNLFASEHTINQLKMGKNLTQKDIDKIVDQSEDLVFQRDTDNLLVDGEVKESENLLKALEKIRPQKSKEKKDFTELLKKSRPFWIIGIILLFIIFRSAEEEKPKNKINNKKDTSNWIKEKNKKDSTRQADRDREDEWDYDEDEQNDEGDSGELSIKIKEKNIDEIPTYSILGKGTIDILDYIIKKDDGKAKFSISVFDITDILKNKKRIEIPCNNNLYSENGNLFLSREMPIMQRAAYLEWTDMFYFPKMILVPSHRGKRKIEFVLNVTSLNTKFLDGEPSVKKHEELYFTSKTEIEIDYKDPGHSEVIEYEEDVNKNIIQLAMTLAHSEKKIEQQSLDIIKQWINREVMWKDYLLDEQQVIQNKMQYSFILNNTHQLLKNGRLSMSNIIKELNLKSSVEKKYDAINLLLNIAGADDKLSLAEDKLLNKTATALELNLERFQKMKTSTIANIETIVESDENAEAIFNLTTEMTDKDKCKKLRIEYTRWNRQTNNSNEKMRIQAKKMTELAANLRKKYNC